MSEKPAQLMRRQPYKREQLQYFLTDFAISIGFKADKARYNRAWHRLWCRIHKLNLFPKSA